MKIKRNTKKELIIRLNQEFSLWGEYYGRNNNVQTRRMFDNEYGLVLRGRSKQGVDHHSNAEDLERIGLSINKSLFNLRTGS